ncbi:MAG: hypothetical protein J6Z36_04260, partial [Clostridia bacterium]|nr:hypothetical protein [Clostridia bacterium]
IALVEKYATAMRDAPLRLFDLYGCLYVQNKTNEEVAAELYYAPEYIRRLQKQLFEYLQNHIKEN